ncbi:MAG: histidine triad (HIT) family protein [Acidimicrobiales bacterium]|jgi:histidine triad (HIT) family protein
MPTVFSLIINGDLPGHFVWSDDVCVGFLSINPITDGHTLVVPRSEVDQWTDVDAADAAHMMSVSHHLGNAIKSVFSPERIGLMIAGFEVPHTHIHVLQLNDMGDMSFANAATTVDHGQLAGFAGSIRRELEAVGHQGVSDAP